MTRHLTEGGRDPDKENEKILGDNSSNEKILGEQVKLDYPLLTVGSVHSLP